METIRRGWHVLRLASRTFLERDYFNLAAAISFYSMLSAIPFLFLMIYTLGLTLGASDDLVHLAIMPLRLVRPHLTDYFVEELTNLTRYTGSLGLFGFGFLLWTATLVFHSITNAFDIIFKAHKKRSFLHSLFYSLIMIPGMGALSFLAVLIIAILKAMNEFQLQIGIGTSFLSVLIVEIAIGRIVPVLLMVILFTGLYKLVPSARVRFKHALLGGIVGTVLWETAIRLFIAYSLSTETYGMVFGSFKTAVIILLSFFYSACVLLLCGEIVAQFGRGRHQDT